MFYEPKEVDNPEDWELNGERRPRPSRKRPRVAIICDLIEERWPSMDLVGDMLFRELKLHYSSAAQVELVRPPMIRRLTALPWIGDKWAAFNTDRILNRFWDYPHWLRKQRDQFDLFHVVDHSYGQLIHALPPERTVVTCHDLDTFRCLLEPELEPRPAWFRMMMQRTLNGFSRAARVICDSLATYNQVRQFNLVPANRALVIPISIHPSCTAKPNLLADAEAARLLGPKDNRPLLLHVGSTIPRKRIDLLLRIFSAVKERLPEARLCRIGGPFSAEQEQLLQDLNLGGSVLVLPFLERDVLAAVYRRAALALQPSDREGFGLPVAEAMACGTPVVASDLPVLREIGGDVASFCPVGKVEAWGETILNLLAEREQDELAWWQRRTAAIAQASKFSWGEHARKVVDVYHDLLN
ncbi:MAG TPA: glycosyltransferase family 1 protein [Blastocatellia bacterium]|nr:glycosyltransferase family 1 protein [Blastocatellia bacterium]